MHTLPIKLQQNTPIIHFKHNDEEASIRATELKPKLDRFLIKEVFDGDKNFDKYKRYLMGYKEGKEQKDYDGKEAFNYKVIVCARGKRIIKENAPMYFGKNGKPVIHNDICVIIKSMSLELKNIIDKYKDRFFMENSFGNRTSKGYGSFSVRGYNEELDANNYFHYLTQYQGNGINNWNELMEEIEKLYKNIRSDCMRQYCITEGYNYDRHEIKDKLFGDIDDYKQKDVLITDLLGLATSEIWDENTKLGVSKSNKKIQRFPSPIFIKPILNNNGYYIYIKLNEIHKDMLNQTFNIKKRIFKRGSKKIHKKPLYLTTPSSFNIHNLIQYGMDNDKKEGLWINMRRLEGR
ncbi:MAG: hypothetical protein N4A57_10780 [Anaeromicrobium sp.]|jgi:hypothetical protein|uniref:hypothetical protein n=1 Tax=Anaeromicrobium sp. TaxID=1929132 RepID=UPI0025D33417|nr:hypothetical protein [Anaeromicrobium sp.]MCT4594736.1 hypothetical protein [Anaeromicrobium sp.]